MSSTDISTVSSLSTSQAVSLSSSLIVVPQTDPAGVLSFTQPPQSVVSFFKIGPSSPITFGWNFTYIVATPTALTIQAVGRNNNTYPVGPTDGIIPGDSRSVVWDPYAWNQVATNVPLAAQPYDLQIWGDDTGPYHVAEPGRLTPNTGLEFALYTPQSYIPLSEGWQCTTCQSSAFSAYEIHPACMGSIVMVIIMLASGWRLLWVGLR